MREYKCGDKAFIVNSKNHSEYNFQICKIESIENVKEIWVILEENEYTTKICVSVNELIPLLYENPEDLKKYNVSIEDIAKLFSEYKGYYDCICKVAEDFAEENDKLKKTADAYYKEKNDYQCKIKEMQKHIDCMKAQIGELRTRCHESARDNFDNKLYGLIHIVGREELKGNKPVLPDEPIKVAEMLIYATGNFNDLTGKQYEYDIFSKSELRQIAEHLLVYCNAEESLK